MKTNDVLQRVIPEVMLSDTLLMIEDNDEISEVRDVLIVRAMHLALECGYEVSFGAYSLDYVMVMIDLPTGQVSWHIKTNNEGKESVRDSHIMRIVQFAAAVAGSL